MDAKRKGPFVDHYAVLGLGVVSDPAEVTLKEINDAYKRIARKHHPDKTRGNASSSAKFIAATQAVEALRNPAKREAFDEEIRVRKREERRRAEQDERTKQMRLDLERREKESELEDRMNEDLERLRRQTESLTQTSGANRGARQTDIKTFTLEQHLAMERAILEKALRFPV